MRYIDIICDEVDLCEHLGLELLYFQQVEFQTVAKGLLWVANLEVSSLVMSGRFDTCWTASMSDLGLARTGRFRWTIWIQSGTGKVGAWPALLKQRVGHPSIIPCQKLAGLSTAKVWEGPCSIQWWSQRGCLWIALLHCHATPQP